MLLVDPLSVFSYFGASSAPRLILRADFSNCNLGAPTFSGVKSYNQTITFGDMNATAMNDFFGTGYALQCQSIIDRPAADAADFVSTIENSIVTVPGPFGANVSALYQNIKNRSLAPAVSNSPNQTWLRALRIHPGGVPAADIKTLYVSYWRRAQVQGALPLDQFLDYTDPSGVAFWRNEFELKEAGYGGSTDGGSYRFTFETDEIASGLIWKARGDNVAANSTVPGVTLGTEGPNHEPGGRQTFWSVTSAAPAVPSDAWYKVEVFIQRRIGKSNRTFVAITPASTMLRTVICDFESSSGLKGVANAQEGIYPLPWGQMFFAGLYADGKIVNYPLNNYVYDLQVWAGAPHIL